MSPKEREPEATGFARAVADAFAHVIEDRGISKRELARLVGRSNNYIAMRFRYEAAFTLTDVDEICSALGLNAGSFIAGVAVPTSTPVSLDSRREARVRGARQDDLATVKLDAEGLAASTDNTPIDPERGGA
ncbi:helix-turn-helix domain-containing protein [Microbacterium sp. 22195]|uniref:helix-turn-helix domain-containing protein n=1 Tax=Microbacterium sp. 22195 TaxID=3453891 RepID=UPI003F833E12